MIHAGSDTGVVVRCRQFESITCAVVFFFDQPLGSDRLAAEIAALLRQPAAGGSAQRAWSRASRTACRT